MLMRGSAEDKNHNPIFTFYLSYLSLILFLKGGFLIMSWCTSSVLLQLLPFIDNRLLGSIPSLPAISFCWSAKYKSWLL